MSKLIRFLNETNIVYVLTATLMSIGLVAVVAFITWYEFPKIFWPEEKVMDMHGLLPLATWCLGGGVVFGVMALAHLQYTKPSTKDENYSKIMFGRALVGIGFILLLDAATNIVAIAGFANSGSISMLFYGTIGETTRSSMVQFEKNVPAANRSGVVTSNATGFVRPAAVETNATTVTEKNETVETKSFRFSYAQTNLIRSIQIMFALGLTLMGALFFFAKSIWEKMKAKPIVQFDERIFWAGLWFRLGEAIVFTVVMFLALSYKGYTQAFGLMPFIALLIGLSVKSAENLVAGITTKIFNAISALFR